jgi:flagellin-like hook-associated protein FlgL
MRTAVYSMGDVQSLIDQSNKRLSTGKKVNSALDNARSYFAAQGFQKDARDLNNLLEAQQNALQVVTRGNKAIEGISKLVESAQALARQARGLASTDTTRDTLGGQVRAILNQADQLARDSTFNGKTLAQASSGTADTLDVFFNTSTTATAQTKITLKSVDVGINSATGLNLSIAGNGFGYTAPAAGAQVVDGTNGATFTAGWTDAELDAFITGTSTALNTLQAAASTLSVNASLIQLRQDFTKTASRINNEQADYLTLADINEEGANLSALQTKQQLAVQALSLASRSDQAILRLF